MAVLVVLGQVVLLPLSIWSEVVLHRYGVSTESWGLWVRDLAVSTAFTVGTTALVVLLLVAVARRAPRTWWAWAAGLAAALVVAGSFLWPVVLEPAFNTLHPMAAGPLRSDLLALAQRNGTPVDDVLVADASRRTTSLNAYVSGIGSTRRIVVYDTVLRTLPDDQIESIVAHELGHVSADDVLTGTLMGALGAAAGVAALGWLLTWRPLLRRAGCRRARRPARGARAAVRGRRRHPASRRPVQNLVSRQLEARADLHALDLARDPAAFTAMQERLAQASLAQPEPPRVWHLLFGDHPTEAERVAMAQRLGAAGRRAGRPVTRTLVVTNDFPPRQGGIQTFVAALLARRPPGSVVVLASDHPGSAEHDAGLPYPVVRRPTGLLLPTRATARAAVELARRHGCDTALLRGGRAARAARAGAAGRRACGGWSGPPTATRPAGCCCPAPASCCSGSPSGLDVVTYISDYTRGRLAPALAGRSRLEQLSPAWTSTLFTPAADGAAVRRRYGLGEGPVVVCVSRLVAAQGAGRAGGRLAAGARPAPVGPAAAGRRRPGRAGAAARGRRPRRRATPSSSPARSPRPSCPRHYAAGDVFAMPCRTRRGGLDVEGLGMVYLEAAACGLPGGRRRRRAARRRPCRTASPGTWSTRAHPTRWPTRCAACSTTRPRARAMGAAGRAWVEQRWSWDTIAGPSPPCWRADPLLRVEGVHLVAELLAGPRPA